jgi:F420-non-reducing hydrogenase large subunit
MPALASDALSLPTCYMGTVKDDMVNFYDGKIRIIDDKGKKLVDFDAVDYDKYMVERPVDWSYTKPVFLKSAAGVPDGTVYRVSNLARLNCAEKMETPGAESSLLAYRAKFSRPCHLTFQHLATRVIELQYACEKAAQLASHPDLLGENRVPAKIKAGRGVGHVEAPRGTLIHDYTVDDKGIVRAANLLVATQQNFTSINKTIEQVVKIFGTKDDALLDAIEFGIRLYDPCLSCATHAVGHMPLEVIVMRGKKLEKRLERRS